MKRTEYLIVDDSTMVDQYLMLTDHEVELWIETHPGAYLMVAPNNRHSSEEEEKAPDFYDELNTFLKRRAI